MEGEGSPTGSFFLKCWTTEKQKKVIDICLRGNRKEFDDDCKLFWDAFNAKEHVKQVQTHTDFVLKSYKRFQSFFPHLTEADVALHDQSKYSFIEVVGYTDRWVHGLENSQCWRLALEHHYAKNAHHPENQIEVTESGYVLQMDMPISALEESVVDMLGCQWERVLKGRDDAKPSEIAEIRDVFLTRYTPNDRKAVRKYLERIAKSKSYI